jgi:hypothetical protein
MSPLKNNEVRQLVVAGLIALAIGGNGFFIKRLVDKIDRVDDIERRVITLQADISIIKGSLGLARNLFTDQEEGS